MENDLCLSGDAIILAPITANIIAMRLKLNCPALLFTALTLLTGGNAHAQGVPLIVPETTFTGLARVLGDTANQRLMDQGSIIQIKLADPKGRLAAGSDLVIFRQGLRLRTADGQTLGVLAMPVAQARTLPRASEDQAIADPDEAGVSWIRVQSLRQEVMRGDSVMTHAEEKALRPTACITDPDEATTAVPPQVVALVGTPDVLSSTADLLAVSGGCAAGLRDGQLVTLWRPPVTVHGRKLDRAVEAPTNNGWTVFDDNPAIVRATTPSHRVGTAVVLTTYPNAAILKIRSASHPVQPGDLIRLNQNKSQP